MQPWRWMIAAAVVVAAAGSGCYKTPKPDCAFRCGDSSDCPEAYVCGPDDRCHLVIEGGQLATCDPLPEPDAMVVEADAMSTAPDAAEEEIDAPLAEPDAAIPTPDAPVPDAPVPDARVFDARVFDAP